MINFQVGASRRCGVVAIGALLLAGCSGGGGFGESVRFTARDQTRVDELISHGERLDVPQAMPFSVAEAQRASTGDGESDSVASPGGTARCHAALTKTGTGSADFQLGHILYSAESAPLEVTVTCDCEFSYELQRGEGVAPDFVSLKFYVKDSNRSVLRREVFVAPEGDLGAARHASHESLSFNITLEPDRAYQLVLAGRVAVSGEDSPAPVAATVEVTQFTITVAAR
ncbi:MAG: hypothetical protein H6816_07465 [Phycisphaerales bacterium]|nr:hypothetical protein [Phycisphaerales bacterium]